MKKHRIFKLSRTWYTLCRYCTVTRTADSHHHACISLERHVHDIHPWWRQR